MECRGGERERTCGRWPRSARGVIGELCLFFFQAEDGIRDYKVTGVQTCALPIFTSVGSLYGMSPLRLASAALDRGRSNVSSASPTIPAHSSRGLGRRPLTAVKIGRASCRERVEISVGAGSLKKKNNTNVDRVNDR